MKFSCYMFIPFSYFYEYTKINCKNDSSSQQIFWKNSHFDVSPALVHGNLSLCVYIIQFSWNFYCSLTKFTISFLVSIKHKKNHSKLPITVAIIQYIIIYSNTFAKKLHWSTSSFNLSKCLQHSFPGETTRIKSILSNRLTQGSSCSNAHVVWRW